MDLVKEVEFYTLRRSQYSDLQAEFYTSRRSQYSDLQAAQQSFNMLHRYIKTMMKYNTYFLFARVVQVVQTT